MTAHAKFNTTLHLLEAPFRHANFRILRIATMPIAGVVEGLREECTYHGDELLLRFWLGWRWRYLLEHQETSGKAAEGGSSGSNTHRCEGESSRFEIVGYNL